MSKVSFAKNAHQMEEQMMLDCLKHAIIIFFAEQVFSIEFCGFEMLIPKVY